MPTRRYVFVVDDDLSMRISIKRLLREQFLMLLLDERRCVEAIPQLLATDPKLAARFAEALHRIISRRDGVLRDLIFNLSCLLCVFASLSLCVTFSQRPPCHLSSHPSHQSPPSLPRSSTAWS